MTGAGRKAGAQLTDRDRRLVALLDDWGGATAQDVAFAWSLDPQIVRRRLLALQRWQMVRSFRPGSLPAMWVPTSLGMREQLEIDGIEPPSVSWGSYQHQRELSRVLAHLHVHVPGRYWSERHIRRDQAEHADEAFSLRLSASGRTHQPDALWFPVIHTAAARKGAIAIEIERSRKGGNRLRQILEAYAAHRAIDHAIYVCSHATHVSTRNVVTGKPWRKNEAPRTDLSQHVTTIALDDVDTAIPEQIQRFAQLGTLL